MPLRPFALEERNAPACFYRIFQKIAKDGGRDAVRERQFVF